MYRLVYSSKATDTVDSDALEAILETARRRNEAAGITGVLLFHDGLFLQVLEGPRAAIEDLMDRIESDPRNADVDRIYADTVRSAMFADWSMAYLPLDGPNVRQLVVGGQISLVAAIAKNPGQKERAVAAFLTELFTAMVADAHEGFGAPALKSTTNCLIFDVYGTLLDLASPVSRLGGEVGRSAPHLIDLWRAKQLEYAWVATLTNRYESFWSLTERALHHSLAALGLSGRASLTDQLLEAYRTPDVYPEVVDALRALSADGHRLVAFSNGNPDMLSTALQAGGLLAHLHDVVSVEPVQLFKPHPKVYEYCAKRLDEPAERIVFMSSNAWDITGAESFGWPTLWVNRKGLPFEFAPRASDVTITTLADLRAKVSPQY